MYILGHHNFTWFTGNNFVSIQLTHSMEVPSLQLRNTTIFAMHHQAHVQTILSSRVELAHFTKGT